MSAPAATLSVLTLPLLGTKSAPELFRGDYSNIRGFLDHYERLCAFHNVVDDYEKVNSILQYCSAKVRETIEGMAHFHFPDWEELKNDLLKYFDADLSDERFYERDLKQFVVQSAHKTISTLMDFREYCREFIRIGGWLLHQGRISEEEHNRYFWAGLPSSFRNLVNSHLLLINPKLDVTQPFPFSDVSQAAEQLLRRDRFDAEYLDILGVSNRDNTVPSPSPRFDPRSDPVRPLLPPHEARTSLQGLQKAEAAAHKQDEVETLIKSLSRMSLTDPDYSLLYYRAIKLDSDASRVVRPPPLHSTHPIPTASSGSAPTVHPRSPGRSITCYGCGVEGHGLNNCEAINDLVKKGSLTRDESRRVILPNGQRLFRNGDETIIQAYERHVATTQAANSVRFVTHDEEELELKIYELEEEESLAAAVDRAPRITKEKRKAVFDGVVLPPYGKGKGKENQVPVNTPIPASRPNAPASASASAPAPAPIRMPVPIDVHPHVFDGSNDDAIMQDDTLPVKSSNSPSDSIEKKKSRPLAAMSSPLSQNTDAKVIVDRILATPFTLSVGEVIGSSKDISQQLQDLLRIRRQAIPYVKNVQGTPPATSYMCLTSSPLITINLHCNGHPVKAVIDSGSTLNVVKASIARSIIKMPIDTSQTMHMRDANGGVSKLVGLIQNVPLFCGAAKTWTNLYVSPDNDSGFDLLLGRPWSHGNSVSIIEKESGTFVIFGADSDHPLEMHVMESRTGHTDTGTGLLAIHEPDGSVEEEKASSVLHPSSPDPAPSSVPSDIPEAPDPDISSSMDLFIAAMTANLQISSEASPTPLSPPGLPAHTTSCPPSIPDPLPSFPITSSTAAPPTSDSTPSHARPTLDEALAVVAEHVNAAGDDVLEPLHPAIASLCAQIREEERRSMLELLILLHREMENSEESNEPTHTCSTCQSMPPAMPPDSPILASDDDPPPSYVANSTPSPPILVFNMEDENQPAYLVVHDPSMSGLQLLASAADYVTHANPPSPSPDEDSASEDSHLRPEEIDYLVNLFFR
jgi:Aspartyl protease